MIKAVIRPAKRNYQEALTVTTGEYLNLPRNRFPHRYRNFFMLPSCVKRQIVTIVRYYTLPCWFDQTAEYVFS